MKHFYALLFAIFGIFPSAAFAQPSHFEHIVLIVQENRTPDNLFFALCASEHCSTKAKGNEYDIQTSHWLDKTARRGTVKPEPVPLANTYDMGHTHPDFVLLCDLDPSTKACRMDGEGSIQCKVCPPHAGFKYVDNSTGIINPYLALATQYGWANYMFQTNQGPSFPAHQFLFGATSAPSKRDDREGTFASENVPSHYLSPLALYGCIAPPDARVQLINAKGVEAKDNTVYPCFEHLTLADLLDRHAVKWRYYTPGPGSLWSAPDAIRHICEPKSDICEGPLWTKNVVPFPPSVLSDIQSCQLRGVSWVIPSAQYSDHAKINTGGGPAWVASIVNAIGNSPCKNSDGSSYWESTAIVITWDDWGGWYDHEPPTILPYPEGGYQYGFRVPMLFVSAYTGAGYISNERLDFGSVARFVEHNFSIAEGKLTFADKRSTTDLTDFYSFSGAPRRFAPIKAPNVSAMLREAPTLEPPDDD